MTTAGEACASSPITAPQLPIGLPDPATCGQDQHRAELSST